MDAGRGSVARTERIGGGDGVVLHLRTEVRGEADGWGHCASERERERESSRAAAAEPAGQGPGEREVRGAGGEQPSPRGGGKGCGWWWAGWIRPRERERGSLAFFIFVNSFVVQIKILFKQNLLFKPFLYF